jgi:outer membrane protein
MEVRRAGVAAVRWVRDPEPSQTLALEEVAQRPRRGTARFSPEHASAYFGVQSGRAQVNALEAAESSSQLALESTQLGYRAGVRVNIDVLNAQTALPDPARPGEVATTSSLAILLRQAAGSLKPEDVATANVLLAK